MELQTIYTQVLQHLARQEGSATNCLNNCFYLDEKTGKRCAVGYLIPSHAYDPRMEGDGVQDASVRRVLTAVYGEDVAHAYTLLGDLQRLHDGALGSITRGDTHYGEGTAIDALRVRLECMEKTYNLIRPKVFNEVFGL